jgi:protein-disulfide isomerase
MEHVSMNKRMALSLAALPALLLAGCGGGAGSGNSTTAAGPVAAKAAPAGQKWEDMVAATPEGGMRMGNPDAPLKIVEYGARTCPHCARFDAEGFPALKSGLIASGKVSYEFRDYPVHDSLDIGPILLGHCVEPAQFFPMLDQMMKNQQTLLANTDKITPADQASLQGKSANEVATFLAEKLGYLDFVKQRGVPEAKARACLADKGSLDMLVKNLQVATDQYQVRSTPTFILNGKKLDDVDTWEKLEPALKAAGA